MKHYFCVFLLICCAPAGFLSAQGKALTRSSPESQGVSSTAIQSFIEAADQEVNSMHSFMLLRNGRVITEAWWAPNKESQPHVLWSLSKSFTSTAVGLAISEGKFDLDDKVYEFFPSEAPAELAPNLKKMRVRDLLTMSAGHNDEVKLPFRGQGNWVKLFLSHPVPHEPGTHFRYNTPASYMLSAIVQKKTGEKVVDYLNSRLFKPIGIQKPRWLQSPQGVTIGGYGLYLKTEDIARFGQLYLQKGKWDGKQIVPEKWVKLATSKQVSNGNRADSDWNQGYGFQFWRCRHGAYRGDGKDGQFCIVLPDKQVVIAITANTRNLQGVLNLVWKHLLPGMGEKRVEEDAERTAKLRAIIKELKATR